MKRIILPFAVCLSVIILLASCLKDNEDDTVYSDDAAITSFTLGTLNRYLTTKASNGTDSIYTVKVTGSGYKMNIDQINHLIYNVDSLPHSTDVSKVVCTVSSKNSGTIVIKNVDSDTVKYYSSTDSIDFTNPRKFMVYSADGSTHHDYTVQLNVHYEKNDSFVWNSDNISLPENVQGMKAVSCNDKMFVFASDGIKTSVLYCDEKNDEGWTTIYTTFPPYSYQDVVTRDNQLYIYVYGHILKSADGVQWKETAAANLLRLVAAGNKSLYALNNSGMLISSDDEGVTWKEEELDDSYRNLPIQDISYCCLPSKVNDSTEYIVLAGNRSVTNYPDDSQAMVWSNVSEYSSKSRHDSWMHITCDIDTLALPRLSGLTIAACNGAVIAIGSSGIGACSESGFSQIYYSKDKGIYWLNDDYYKMPTNFDAGGAFAMTVDSQGFIWIITAGGKVWKGYYPNDVWKESQKSFTE